MFKDLKRKVHLAKKLDGIVFWSSEINGFFELVTPPPESNKTKEDFSPKHGLGQQEKKALLAVEK